MVDQQNPDIELFYQEIHVPFHVGLSVGSLMSLAMNQIHFDLVRIAKGQQSCNVGISFPGYADFSKDNPSGRADDTVEPKLPPIGDRIRLFAKTQSELEELGIPGTLTRFSDYLDISDIRPLKRRNISWSIFKRSQPTGSPERLARRRMKRFGGSADEAMEHFAGMAPTILRLPYLDMQSHSTKKRFRLFIERKPQLGMSGRWEFSTYGLSASIAVPDF
ncbi:type I-F CRISPR-associated endoribonuclease Cas6/Csy4 [Pirellulaceae bacterium SH467]